MLLLGMVNADRSPGSYLAGYDLLIPRRFGRETCIRPEMMPNRIRSQTEVYSEPRVWGCLDLYKKLLA